YVGELIDGPAHRLKTVAVCRNQAVVEDFRQDLPGTASYQVLIDGVVAWRTGASRIFPLDPLLDGIAAETYVGGRVCCSAGQVLGLLAVVSRFPLPNVSLVKSVLETFVPRTAAELERMHSDAVLRESQERYRNFIAFSSDAMWRIEFEGPVLLDLPEDEQIE